MYRIVDGVKTPYNVLSAQEALELSLNDAEREEFCEIIDCIHKKSLDNETSYVWYYDPKRRFSDDKMDNDKILALLKYNGYTISHSAIKTESGLWYYGIFWDIWKEDIL